MNIPYDPNQHDPNQYDPNQPIPSKTPKVVNGENAKSAGIILGLIVAIILLWFLASVIIQAVGGEATRFFRHLTHLFNRAPYMFHNPKAFGAFVELILIAVFVGWVISRFKNR